MTDERLTSAGVGRCFLHGDTTFSNDWTVAVCFRSFWLFLIAFLLNFFKVVCMHDPVTLLSVQRVAVRRIGVPICRFFRMVGSIQYGLANLGF